MNTTMTPEEMHEELKQLRKRARVIMETKKEMENQMKEMASREDMELLEGEQEMDEQEALDNSTEYNRLDRLVKRYEHSLISIFERVKNLRAIREEYYGPVDISEYDTSEVEKVVNEAFVNFMHNWC